MLRACGVRWKNFNLRTRGENLFEGPGGGNKSKTCKLYTPLKIYPRPLRIMEMIMQHCKKSLTLMCHSLQQKKNKDKKPQNTDQQTKDLFRSLPFPSEEDVREEEEERKKFACIPYILPPQTCSQKGRCQHHLHIWPQITDILCGANKTRPDPQKKNPEEQ